MFKKSSLAIMLSACMFSGAVLATGSDGYYLGLQLGESMSDYTTTGPGTMKYFDVPELPDASIQNDAFAARLYLGYQFNKYFAAEFAYDYFGTVTFDNIDNISGSSADIRQQGLDLTAKVMLPITKQFDVFALGGLSYRGAKAQNISTTADKLGLDAGGGTQYAFSPIYGLGADYNFNDAWGLDLAWRRFIQKDNLSQVSLATAGVSYHFG
ncbi:MAG: outer membrane beta-barrel protein [Legionellales bacterium]|nr:outer membrane beta-barrel protein [Legionellales bacterium]